MLNLIREIIISASSVIRMIWRAQDPEPVIIEFHSGFESRLKNVLLANSITLTPGTITVFLEGDKFLRMSWVISPLNNILYCVILYCPKYYLSMGYEKNSKTASVS